jgi:hypothetical protein
MTHSLSYVMATTDAGIRWQAERRWLRRLRSRQRGAGVQVWALRASQNLVKVERAVKLYCAVHAVLCHVV